MNLDELHAARSRERRTDSLQDLRDGFYEEVDGYLAGLRAERDRALEAADNPFESAEARRLQDEVESAEVTLEAVWEARVAKIVRNASLAAHDYPADEGALTPAERDLYAELVERIAATRGEVVAGAGEDHPPDVLTDGAAPIGPAPEIPAGGSGPGAGDRGGGDGAADAVETAADAGAGTSAADVAEAGANVAEAGADAAAGDAGRSGRAEAAAGDPAAADRTTVRLTDDVGAILGVDEREYDLAAEDVVTLPDENAEPLLERGAAERVD